MEELHSKLGSFDIVDVDDFVLKIQTRFAEAGSYSQRSCWPSRRYNDPIKTGIFNMHSVEDKLEVLAEKLIDTEGSRDAAFTLCFALRARMDKYILPLFNHEGSTLELARLDILIIRLLHPGHFERCCLPQVPPQRPSDSPPTRIRSVDLAAAARQLRTCMPANAARCASVPARPGAYLDSSGGERFRRRTLRLLAELQKAAYGQLRANLYLTLGTLLPGDLCLLVFECVLAANEIPPDPTGV